MARSQGRYSVYPAPKAIEIVGGTAPALNQAIECWAALLLRATADNAKKFLPSESILIGEILHEQPLHHWELIANVIRWMRFDPDFANPAELLATAVDDAHRLENAGRSSFYRDEFEQKDVDNAVGNLVGKLRGLDYQHAWAVIVAVRWFWDHAEEGINIHKDDWWTLAYRRRWHQRHAIPAGLAELSDLTSRSKRKKRKPTDGRLKTKSAR